MRRECKQAPLHNIADNPKPQSCLYTKENIEKRSTKLLTRLPVSETFNRMTCNSANLTNVDAFISLHRQSYKAQSPKPSNTVLNSLHRL